MRQDETRPRVGVIAFTNFGYEKDLKTQETYRLLKGIEREAVLQNASVLHVTGRYDIDRDVVSSPIPGGIWLTRLFHVVNMLSPRKLLDPRIKIMETLDYFSSRRLGDLDVLIAFPGMERSLETARENGTTTVAYAPSPHPETMLELLERESAKYPEGDGTYEERLRYMARGYEHTDYVFCLSDFSVQSFLDKGFDEDRVIKIGPLGVDQEQYAPTSRPDDEFVVVSVANYTTTKGVGYLLDAWEQVERADARLVLCGSATAEVEPEIERYAARNERIEYVGHVSEPYEYYKQASVLAHPSVAEGGLPKVVLEAMASGVPVLTTENAGGEFIRGGGYVVPPFDTDELLAGLERLYEERDTLDQMGTEARRLVETEYNWPTFTDRVSTGIRKIER